MLYEKSLSRDLVENSVHTLRKRIYKVHPQTGVHCDRTADLAVMIGDKYGLPDNDLFNLYNAALIHDVGKTTPEFFPILSNKGKPTDAQWKIIKRHPDNGAKMARLEGLDDIAKIIYQHHEWHDGKGYYSVPKQEILPTASILVYADSYDAMTENGRPYTMPFGPGQALRQISSEVGSQFNPEYFGAFEATIRDHLVMPQTLFQYPNGLD